MRDNPRKTLAGTKIDRRTEKKTKENEHPPISKGKVTQWTL